MRQSLRARATMCSAPAPPCTDCRSLLRAVVSKLPPGAVVSVDQLSSLCGVYSRDLTGLAFKEVPGSFEASVRILLGPSGREDRKLTLPAEPIMWEDPRPPAAPSTRCLGDIISNTTSWLTNEPEGCDSLIGELGFETAPFIGLDCEWTPRMVRGQQRELGLLQLATRDKCMLVRVGQMQLPLPPGLTRLLEAEAPLKVGRGLRADVSELRRLGCEVGGATELAGKESLKSLARSVGGLTPPSDGGWMTHWNARELTEDKLRYAAFDAFAAVAIFEACPSDRRIGAPKSSRKRSGRTRSHAARKRR